MRMVVVMHQVGLTPPAPKSGHRHGRRARGEGTHPDAIIGNPQSPRQRRLLAGALWVRKETGMNAIMARARLGKDGCEDRYVRYPVQLLPRSIELALRTSSPARTVEQPISRGTWNPSVCGTRPAPLPVSPDDKRSQVLTSWPSSCKRIAVKRPANEPPAIWKRFGVGHCGNADDEGMRRLTPA